MQDLKFRRLNKIYGTPKRQTCNMHSFMEKILAFVDNKLGCTYISLSSKFQFNDSVRKFVQTLHFLNPDSLQILPKVN